ncbi:hypothetical protein IIA28_13315 [candidate division KSB1 bacterium]|nr:hypothetical protein [candidate division KSB1 bacterium]
MKKSLICRSGSLFSLLVIVLALSVSLWVACGEKYNTIIEPEETQEVVLSPSNPQVRAVMEIQDRYTKEIMARPGIVGTATGMTEDGRPAIIVFAKTAVLAKTAALPTTLEAVPVIVQVTGEFKALKGPPGGEDPGGEDPTARQDRPVPIGVSTGHPSITAGTIGCRVTDGTNVYALSNNHVYAATNSATIGDAVIQPGTFDGGSSPADDIGTLFDFEPIDFSAGATNIIDAAIALSTTEDLGNATLPDGYGTPLSTAVAASIGDNVMKYGRTTGFTTSKVQAINATVNVNYGDPGVATFVDQIVISGGGFSAGGDSGSLIIRNDGSKRAPIPGPAVALLYAGGGGSTIGCPIEEVLARFGVTIDGN